MSDRPRAARGQRERRLKRGAFPKGSVPKPYSPFNTWEKNKKGRKRAKIMNPSAFYGLRSKIRAALDPVKGHGPVREMKDMTPEEIEKIKARYAGNK